MSLAPSGNVYQANTTQSLPIRQFLLTNLVRSEDNTLKSRVPLSIIGGALNNMADFPFKESDNLHYDGPTLFVRGTKSKYVSDDTVPAIKKFFPNAQIVDIEAGHWLISEKPEEFRQGNSLLAIINNSLCLHDDDSGREVFEVDIIWDGPIGRISVT